MKLTVEHAIIGVVALALIYFVVQHRNLLNKHIDLKVVQGKHNVSLDEIERRAEEAGINDYKPPFYRNMVCSNAPRHSDPDSTVGRVCNSWWNLVDYYGMDKEDYVPH